MTAKASGPAGPVVHLVVPGDPGTKTGGYIYDRRIAAELEQLGWQVATTGLDGRFPDADRQAIDALHGCLFRFPDSSLVVMDGLALSAVPEIVRAHSPRLDIVGLVHHPLGDESGLDEKRRRLYYAREIAALSATIGVIVTSPFTGRRLAELGADACAIRVAEPGTDPSPPARGSKGAGRRLLCVATVTPRKRHDILIEALEGIAGMDWTLDCVGHFVPGDDWAKRVFGQLGKSSIGDRVNFTGVRTGDELASCFDAADLFVLASEYEGFGMVFTEALARGLPVVGTTGGAIPDTVAGGAGVLVSPGDADALGGAVAGLLGDDRKFGALKAGALAARESLWDWPSAGRLFESHLREFLER